MPLPSPLKNAILAALSPDDYGAFAFGLELVRRKLGATIYESGGVLDHVYFPVSGIVSLLYVTSAGDSAELAVIGSEGMVGLSLFMGGETTPNRAVVQSDCIAYRLPAQLLKQQFAKGGQFQVVLLKYTQALLTQISQTAVCNLHHSVRQQFSRWLLLSLDRVPGNELRMTQELIANMLGVQRQGVNRAASDLEQAGLIRYRRGLITVLDRPGIELRCCECYQVVNKEFNRLMRPLASIAVKVR